MTASKPILIATDFAPAAAAALVHARRQAIADATALHIVHVVEALSSLYLDLPNYDPIERLQRALEEEARSRMGDLVRAQDASMAVTGVVLTSHAIAEAIAAYARDADATLIVVGTHGRGAVKRFLLGSVAERLIRMTPCPVTIVRDEYPGAADLPRSTVTAFIER